MAIVSMGNIEKVFSPAFKTAGINSASIRTDAATDTYRISCKELMNGTKIPEYFDADPMRAAEKMYQAGKLQQSIRVQVERHAKRKPMIRKARMERFK